MQISKSQFIKLVNPNLPQCALPSNLNLPITGMKITINSEEGQGLFGQDKYQLDKITIKNIQNENYNKRVIVGESHAVNVPEPYQVRGVAGVGGINDASEFNTALIASFGANGLTKGDEMYIKTPVSTGSFIMLKFGEDVRLPIDMAPGMTTVFNMVVEVECDLSKLPVNSGLIDTVELLRNSGPTDLGSGSQAPLARLENLFYNRMLLTLSGTTFSTVYNHKIQMTPNDYKVLLNNIKQEFANKDKDDIFDNRILLGGGVFDKISNAVDWLSPKLEKAVKLAKIGKDAYDVVKGSGSGSSSMDHAVEGGKVDWKKMLMS